MRVLGDHATVRQAKPITLPNSRAEPEPDIAIVQPLGREYLSHHPYSENIFWIIKYSDSNLSKDLNLKTQVYAKVNIPEYWVVDLKRQILIVFREPEAGQHRSQTEHTEGQITSLAFPNIALSVSSIIDKT